MWAVHALVVMLEWCYTIDLLDSASASVGRGLRQMQSSLTEPWLATVLAIASVLAAYNGLIRRRVAETLGQALMTLAMMAGGMWVILDPTGTVGALGGWANQASLGTLAVTARGTPSARRTRAGGQHGVGRSPPRSKRRGATWSSAPSAGVETRRAWTRGCARPA